MQIRYSQIFETFQVDGANRSFDKNVYFNVRTIGATGTIYAGIIAATDDSIAGSGRPSTAAEATVDTTGALPITFTAQYSDSDANHAISIQAGLIQIVNAT